MLLAGFWPFFLEPLSDSPSAEVTRRSWRLLSGFHFIFHAKWTRMQLLDMVLACLSCATTENMVLFAEHWILREMTLSIVDTYSALYWAGSWKNSSIFYVIGLTRFLRSNSGVISVACWGKDASQGQFGSCVRWVTFEWRLALSTFRVSVRGLTLLVH